MIEPLDYFSLKKQIKDMFLKAGITEMSDIDWIMVEITGISRSMLPFAGKFAESQTEQILKAAELRAKHIPLGYIFGHSEFYGYDFKVNQNVLIPRLDTEILIDKLKEDISSFGGVPLVLDIGTGSGVIAITLALETGAKLTAVDVSEPALELALENAGKNGVQVNFIHSNLFENVNGKFDYIVSNPPYIETEVVKGLEAEVVDNEPLLALDGGEDGLDFYRKIIAAAPNYLNVGGRLYFEIGYNQAESVKNLMQYQFKNIKVYKDYAGNDRVVCGEIL